jgi:lysozyme family protein
MANYRTAIDKVLKVEGFFNGKAGYVNDPRDNGGETVAGITRKNYPNSKVWAIVDEMKKKTNFPKNLASRTDLYDIISLFYKAEFWNKIQADNIADQDIADMLVSTCVLEGLGTGIKRAYSVVGLAESTKISDELIEKINLV